MKRGTLLSALAVLCAFFCMSASTAWAVTINFDSINTPATGSIPITEEYKSSGVVFSLTLASGATQGLPVVREPWGGNGAYSLPNGAGFGYQGCRAIATFVNPTTGGPAVTNAVSAYVGDRSGEADPITMIAYNLAGAEIGRQQFTSQPTNVLGVQDFGFVSIQAAGIYRVVFIDQSPSGADFDNFTFNPVTPVNYSITGRVVHADGTGFAGVQVCANTTNCVTTPDTGLFTFANLPQGSYTITPSAAGYSFSPASASATLVDHDVNLDAFFGTRLLNAISGTISGGTAGIHVTAGGLDTVTDAAGNYRLYPLPDGHYTITPSDSRYYFDPAAHSRTVSGADVTGVDFTATLKRFSISGRIIYADGRAFPGVRVCAGGTCVTSSSSGTFTIPNLPVASYIITPTASGYTFSPASQTAVLLDRDITLPDFSGTAAGCNNGIDDDLDGLTDLADPGCSSVDDQDESDDPLVAPAAPTNLSASDGTSQDYVEITWNPAQKADTYQVYRSEYPNEQGAPLGSPVSGTSYQDRTAVPGVTYWYSVKASNGAGTSGFSNTDSGYRFDPNNTGDSDGDGVSDEQEEIDGTDPHDRGSFQLHLKSPAFSKYNTFLKQWNFLELIATGTKQITAKVTVYLLDGRELTSKQVVVDPQTETDVDINSMLAQACSFTSLCANFKDLDGNGVIDTYGVVRIDFNNELAGETMSGRMSNYRKDKDNLNFSFAFAKELRNPTRGNTQAGANTYDPQGVGYLVPNWLEIINLDTVPRTFDTRLYDQEGKQVSAKTVTVSPLGETDIQAGHEITDAKNKVRENVYLAEVIPQDGAAQYFATVSRYSSNAPAGVEPESYNFAFAIDGRAGTGDTQYMVTSNETGTCYSQTNWVEVINVREKAVTASIIFRGTDGSVLSGGIAEQVIKPKAQFHFNAGAMLPKGKPGSVELVSSDPGALVAQSLVYYHDCTENKVQTAYVSQARIAGRDVQAGSINTFLGMEDQLRVVATSQTRTAVTAELRTFDAGAALITAQLELSNYNTNSIQTNGGQFTVQADRYGALTLRASEPGKFTAEVLRVRPAEGGRIDFAMPTVVQ